jgi:hypothetical protein
MQGALAPSATKGADPLKGNGASSGAGAAHALMDWACGAGLLWDRYYLMTSYCYPCDENKLAATQALNTYFLYFTIGATAVLPTTLLLYL